MSPFFKLILAILGGLLVLAVAGGAVAFLLFRSAATGIGNAAAASRDDVAGAAAQIAAIQLPAGFEPDYTFTAAGYAVAAYKGSDGRSHLILARGPKDLDIHADDLKMYADQQTGSRYRRLTPTGSFDVQIDGQAVAVQISEGRSSDGTVYRQASAAFQGQNGPTLVTLTRPLSAWNEHEAKELFSSIRSLTFTPFSLPRLESSAQNGSFRCVFLRISNPWGYNQIHHL